MTVTDTPVLAPDGEPFDARVQRLADEAAAIMADLNATSRPFTQAEDDRLTAISTEVAQLHGRRAMRAAG
jgi:hypothetical protein